MMEDQIVLGVDIGGSHITATLIDLKTGTSLKSRQVREPVNAKGTVSEIVSLWSSVIERAFSGHALNDKKIGIAMPGPFDYLKGIAWMKNQDKYDSLYGLNVKELLAESLDMPAYNIRFINDAESFLKGEVFSGVAKGTSKAIGLTFGTGLGSAKYFNGSTEDADLWHTAFLDGIAEDYLSTRWFIARYSTLSGEQISGVKDLAALAINDAIAMEVFREFGLNLSAFLQMIINDYEPQIIVIGGNISKAFPLFKDELHRQLHVLTNNAIIQKAKLGEEASLIGAASCWRQVNESICSSSSV
ncbi:MAG TPA: ROK family protein [Segetibacter sp.]|jgi:glucokinase